MSQTIPIDCTNADFKLIVELDAIDYALRFCWNERDAAWYMDVMQVDETPIRMGLKVVIDYPIGFRFKTDPRFPPGILQATDTANTQTEAGRDDFGTRVQLLYFPVTDPVVAR